MLLSTEPLSAPEFLDITSANSVSFSISWLPPPIEETNGIIREYSIILTELDTGNEVDLRTNETEYFFADLHPYYTYRSSVAASTVGLGPYTDPLTVQLDEEGELLLYIRASYILISPHMQLPLPLHWVWLVRQ